MSSVHIWPDGLVEPSNAPIQRNGDVYTFTDNINAAMTVEKSNIIIDGNNYLLQSDNYAKALSLNGVNNVVIKNLAISNSRYAVYVENSSFITLENNVVSDCGDGLVFESCRQNTISGNLYGVYTEKVLTRTEPQEFSQATNNTITGNLISGNTGYGIYFNTSSQQNNVYLNSFENNNIGVGIGEDASRNLIYNNNFLNNKIQTSCYPWRESFNSTYPTGGNFWSDYTGEDNMSGPNQSFEGNDSVGDTPHVLDSNNKDYYPLMHSIEIPKLDVPSAPQSLPSLQEQTQTQPSTQPQTPEQTPQPNDTQQPTKPQNTEQSTPIMWITAAVIVTAVSCVSLGLIIYLKKL